MGGMSLPVSGLITMGNTGSSGSDGESGVVESSDSLVLGLSSEEGVSDEYPLEPPPLVSGIQMEGSDVITEELLPGDPVFLSAYSGETELVF
ncbi:hypothetical protein JCM12294_06170 [Desulfocicer niacini]